MFVTTCASISIFQYQYFDINLSGEELSKIEAMRRAVELNVWSRKMNSSRRKEKNLKTLTRCRSNSK